MTILKLALFAISCVATAMGIDLFPGETWTSGHIALTRPGDSLFYLLFRSRSPAPESPLIIWLSGGPGCASTLAMYEENGPYKIDRKTFAFRFNEYGWNVAGDVLYVDQPVGVGFSEAQSNDTLCKDEACVAEGFYGFLVKFVDRYPEYATRKVYITGESYAGRYIPAIVAHVIKAHGKIQIAGMAIGNPYIEQETQIATYPQFLYENGQIGLISYCLLRVGAWLCQSGIRLKLGNQNQMCDLEPLGLVNITNPINIHDNDTYFRMHAMVKRKLADPLVQKELGVNKPTFSLCSPIIPIVMAGEKAKSQRQDLEYILNAGTKVMLYFGTNDAVCDWIGGQAFALSLNWKGKAGFGKVPENEWRVGGKVAGTTRKYGNFEFRKVYDAGHMVPFDQPAVSLEMIKGFVSTD